MVRVTKAKRDRLIADIMSAEHDVVALARTHELTPDQLAEWAAGEDNRRCLGGLCVLADIQTQLLLSRYRLLAATRLIKLATDEEGSGDIARRACVDLLKLDLKRADMPAAPSDDADDADAVDPLAVLTRQSLYENADDEVNE